MTTVALALGLLVQAKAAPLAFDRAAALASHERMKRELATIAAQRDVHPFLGTSQLDQFQKQLEALPPGFIFLNREAALPRRLGERGQIKHEGQNNAKDDRAAEITGHEAAKEGEGDLDHC